jgi:O-acetyl-ADP-ribose deacetylase (regulator of RNase III)
VLEKAKALNVGVLWVPLMGAGVASLGPKQSFEGILEAIADWQGKTHQIIIMIVIYKEGELPRHVVAKSLKSKQPKFTVHLA